MINFENVSKFIVEDISFYIPKGEIVGLIGASGAGKTTFIKLACGLLNPEKGRVTVFGKNPVVYRQRYYSDIGVFLAGVNSLDMDTTVKKNFEILKAVYGIPGDVFEERYQELSERFGFKKHEFDVIRKLSLGYKMRVELAAVFILEPKLLLLDEPNVGLDENAKQVLRQILNEKAQNGMTIIITSHDMVSISGLCTRLMILHRGKLVYYGSQERLRGKYLPIDKMFISYHGKIPAMDDLPIRKYTIEKDNISLEYNHNYISSLEVLEVILSQTNVLDVKIEKSDLESIVMQIINGGKQ